MSESDPIDLSNLQNLQFRPSWVEDLAKSDAPGGEVIWGRAPGGSPRGERDDRPRRDGPPRRDGGRGFDRNDRGPRPDSRGPRPEFRGPPPGQGDRRPPPRRDGPGPSQGERREGGPDRRGPRPEGPRRDGPGGRPPFRRDDRRDPRGDFRDQRDMPAPLMGWQVSLVPDPRSVEAIARQIKASGRAFSVFDVGRLFMDSRERYQVRFKRQPAPPPQKPSEGDAPAAAPAPSGPGGPEALYQCQADGSLWLTRDEAIRHLLNSPALTRYYRAETVTTEAPKGVWNAIAVCGFSGALLGPPNHHDFQRNVARLHRERFSDMPLERYKSRIRTEKDEALLLKWQEQQSTATHWVAVSAEPLPEGAEPPAAFKSVAEMEAHFLRTHAAEAALPVTNATVSGNIPGKNLAPPLLHLLRREVDNQMRFPMQLVQDLCRALESQGLRFFKRDKKTTCVCKNRPHFLPDDLVLSERVRSLVEMVRANPGITYSRLVSTLAPHIVAASSMTEHAPSAQAMVEAAVEEAAAAPEAVMEEVTPAAAETAEASAVVETEAAPAAEIPSDVSVTAEAAPADAPAPDASAEAESVIATDAPAAAESAPAVAAPPAPATAPAAHLSPEEIAILQDLHWLVQEGYVTEFQSGELFVLGRPPLPPVEKKPRGPRPPRPEAKEGSAPAVEAAPSSEPGAGQADAEPGAAEEQEPVVAAEEPAAVTAEPDTAAEVPVAEVDAAPAEDSAPPQA